MTKSIYLARHAKSAWDTNAASDFERPLNQRGESDAQRMGETLKAKGWLPDKIICSTALRTQQTCFAYCDAFGFSVQEVENKIEWNESFYAAYMVTLLQSLTNLPESLKSVMLVGHNPAMEDLLSHLCSDSSSYQQNDGKLFTTGNVAKISIAVDWKDLMIPEAKLEALLRPKEL
jgi:phosphohistidine phosphatase